MMQGPSMKRNWAFKVLALRELDQWQKIGPLGGASRTNPTCSEGLWNGAEFPAVGQVVRDVGTGTHKVCIEQQLNTLCSCPRWVHILLKVAKDTRQQT